MEAPDLFRAVMISLASLLIGTIVFGAFSAWRYRFSPHPKRAPFSAVAVFLATHVLLLLQLLVDRWDNLGQAINVSGVVAMVALVMNVVAFVTLIRSISPDPKQVKGGGGAGDTDAGQ